MDILFLQTSLALALATSLPNSNNQIGICRKPSDGSETVKKKPNCIEF
jgi:hypothetical protein